MIKKLFKWAFMGIGALAFLIVVVAIASPSPTPSGTSPNGLSQVKEEAPVEALRLSASALYQDYEDNELAADTKYKRKVVVVSGAVQSIGKDILGSEYVSLKTNHILGVVQCMLDRKALDQAATLKTGQSVSMRGTVSGKSMNIIIRDCVFE